MLAQLLGNHYPNAGIVVTDKDQPLAALGQGWCVPVRRGIVGGPGGARQLHPQRSAWAVAVGLRPDGAAMLGDDRTADRQPQASSALLSRVRGLDLVEAVKD